jgi:heat shock protein HtpX
MWEAIRANQRRSRLLIVLMGLVLLSLGTVIGGALGGGEGVLPGLLISLVLWVILFGVATLGGEQVVLLSAGARPVKKEDAPQLWNVVEEMTIASGLSPMPKIYLIDEEMPNAFATGRTPETACVVVTSGLMKQLNRDELQGVMAHEIAHVKNLDVRFMTLAAVMVGGIAMLADGFFRAMWWSGGGRRSSRGGGGQAQAAFMAAALVGAIVAPIAAQLLYFACSRKREYLADASAARYTRYPPGLASALAKISGIGPPKERARWRSVAPMFIVNPLQAAGSAGGWFSTHPPTAKRIGILQSMGGAAGWVDYENAFRKVVGGDQPCLGEDLRAEASVAARQATPTEPKREAVERAQEVTDLLDRMVGLLLIPCLCGVRIKVPADLRSETVRCTRCGRDHAVPHAETETDASTVKGDEGPLSYRRRGGEGWESFKCSCGRAIQLSPAFSARSVHCPHCKRAVEVLPP